MPGAAVFPTLTTSFTAHVTVDGGKQDAVKNTVGSRVSQPSFVDNALHHAIYKKGADVTGRQYTVTKPLQSDFQVTHGKRYGFTEEEESMLLTHIEAEGVKSQVPAFFNTVRMQSGNTPPVLLFAGEDSLRAHSITTATKGSRLNLRNLKGKTLKQLGLNDSVESVQAGQLVNAGLRTTDVVMRVFRNKKHSLNSVALGRPFSGSGMTSTTTYKGNNNIAHSTTFLSQNFRSSTIPNVLRALARHDHYSMTSDRFGNFIYTARGFRETGVILPTTAAPNVRESNISDTPNRVVLKGLSVALNDDNEAVMDDAERQKSEGSVKSETYHDPTATTLAASRKSANLMLRLNRKAKGSINILDIPSSASLSPGDIVRYTPPGGLPRREAILEATHRLSDVRSDFTLMSYETGIERVLSQTQVETESQKEGEVVAGAVVDQKKIFSLGLTNIRVTGRAETRKVAVNKARVNSGIDGFTFLNTGNDIHSGFLIGHRGYDTGNFAARGALGTGLTPRITGSHSSGTITVSATTGFPTSGHLMMRKTTTDAVHVVYTGKTNTTFTGVSLQAPSGGSIPTGTCDLTLLRPKAHEIGVVKDIPVRRVI